MKVLTESGFERVWGIISNELDQKVSNESGKGLSTNDYTTEEKNKLQGISEGATANIGTITGVTGGNGLTGSGTSGSVTLNVGAGTGITVETNTVSAKLRSSTALTVNSAAATTTSGRVYPVVPDKSGYLAVNVPWTNAVTSVNSKTGAITLAAGDVGAIPITADSATVNIDTMTMNGHLNMDQGNIYFPGTNPYGVCWGVKDGTKFYLRSYIDENVLRLLALPSGETVATELIRIDTDGNVILKNALAVAQGGTGATEPIAARANLGAAAIEHEHYPSDIVMQENANNNYIKFSYAENVNTYRGIQYTTTNGTKYILRPHDSDNSFRVVIPTTDNTINAMAVNSAGKVTFSKPVNLSGGVSTFGNSVQSGYTTVSVGATTYKDVTITFSSAFASTPYPMVCIQTGSDAASYGNVSCAVLTEATSTTQMKVRVFHNSTGSKTVGIRWLAIGSK